MNFVLIVLSQPKPDRDDEYNDWYTNVHIRDVMKCRGAIAVQRFKASAIQRQSEEQIHPYLAIYETDDIAKLIAGHAPCFTSDMPISDAFSFENIREAFYHPLMERTNRPGTHFDGAVIIERIHSSALQSGFEGRYMDTRFPSVMGLPGIVFGGVYGLAEQQMLNPHPDSALLGIYRTENLAQTMKASEALDRQDPASGTPDSAIIGCYEPLMRRLPADDVRHPDPESQARADRARRALGDRVYTSLPSQERG